LKNKLILISVFLLMLVLSSCGGKKTADTTANEESQHPENGVYYEYSDGGNSDRVVSSITYENGIEISRNEYDYWENGRLRTITTKVGDKVTDTWNYNYSAEGFLSQMVRQYTEDSFECRDDYRYDNKGNITSIALYTDDRYIGGGRYSYTEDGDTTLEERLDANGDVIAYTEYVFGENKKVASLNKYMYGSLMEYGLYEYSEGGLLSSVKYYSSSDELTQEIKNEYNAEKKISRILTCAPDGTILSYTECLYDESGFNYRDIFYEDGKPIYCYDYTEEGARIYSAYN